MTETGEMVYFGPADGNEGGGVIGGVVRSCSIDGICRGVSEPTFESMSLFSSRSNACLFLCTSFCSALIASSNFLDLSSSRSFCLLSRTFSLLRLR